MPSPTRARRVCRLSMFRQKSLTISLRSSIFQRRPSDATRARCQSYIPASLSHPANRKTLTPPHLRRCHAIPSQTVKTHVFLQRQLRLEASARGASMLLLQQNGSGRASRRIRSQSSLSARTLLSIAYHLAPSIDAILPQSLRPP